jgi:hypothetical protein
MARGKNYALEALIKEDPDEAAKLMPPAPLSVVRDLPRPDGAAGPRIGPPGNQLPEPVTVVAPTPALPDAPPAPAAPPPPAAAEPLPPFPAAPPPPPAPDPLIQAELARARQEAEDLRKRLSDERIAREAEDFHARRARAELEAQRSQLEQLRQRQEMEASLADLGDDFETLTPADARKVIAAASKLAERRHREEIEELRRRQEQADAQFRQYLETSHAGYLEAHRERMDREILAGVPEFTTLMQDQDFLRYITSPVSDGAGTTRRQLMTKELQEGRPAYTIKVARDFLAGRASLDDLAQVSPASSGLTGGRPPAAQPVEDALDPLLDAVRMNKLSRAEYRERIKALAGKPAPSVRG